MGRSFGNRSARQEENTSLIVLIVHIVANAANRKFVLNEGIVPAWSSGEWTNGPNEGGRDADGTL
jgi:hypothetical protein